MAEEFYSFEDALRELRLKEEELKRLVSEGEIRAFREGDTMKLRRADVETLRQELSGGAVVDLGGSEDEIVFEDSGLGDQAGMATEEISDVDTIIEDDVEDVGEIDLDYEDEEELVAAAPVKRTSARAALEDDAHEDMLTRFALIASALVGVVALPVLFAVMTGRAGTLAQAVASLFGEDLGAL